MAKKKITIASVKALEPKEVIWDTEINGFGCRCQKDAKTFLVKYRFGKGRTGIQRLYTIGKLGSPWTPDTARAEAKSILGLVSHGKDPADDRKKEKELLYVKTGFESFLEEIAAKKKPRTHTEYKWQFDKFIEPEIGNSRIDLIGQNDIKKLHSSLKDTPYQANRVLALLSSFFTWCDKNGHRADGKNPCRHVEKFEESSRERFLSETEVYALGHALQEYEEENKFLKEHPHKKKKGKKVKDQTTLYVTAAIRLLLLTGARRNEILTLKWQDVDFERKLIRLQESKTGQKTIYLSAPALLILSDIPRIENNPYVIVGKKERSHLVNIKDAWGDIRSKAKLKDVRIHDLRHNYASTAMASGHHLKVIGTLLGHSNTKTTERYAHLANDPLQTANEAISNRILDAMTTKPVKNNIRPMKK